MGKEIRKIEKRLRELLKNWSFRYVLWLSFSLVSIIVTVSIGMFMNFQYSKRVDELMEEQLASSVSQASVPLYSHIRSMLKASDALYYNVIRSAHFPEDSVYNKFKLVCEINPETIESIALFDDKGNLLEASPPSILNERIDIQKEEWFQTAIQENENVHFFDPKVQNLYVASDNSYNWVIPMSRAVQIDYNGETIQGVLLINLKYSWIENIFDTADLSNIKIAMLNEAGETIYDPRQYLVSLGLEKDYTEIFKEQPSRDGTFSVRMDGEKYLVSSQTIGYTGWKIIGIGLDQEGTVSSLKGKLFIMMLFFILMTILLILNVYISNRICSPIQELAVHVHEIEEGNLDETINVSGSREICQLGSAISQMKYVIKNLMKDIVIEYEQKRKTELDALQSQINPHFLYNTLDIIVWMIENEQQEEAVKVVTALGRLFRISLSKGKRIIPLKNEIEHVTNYLMIQQVRFDNKFSYSVTMEEGIGENATLKLIVQPIVENAIYHGMEYMYGDGEITINVTKQGEDILIAVKDNGPGMTQEMVQALVEGKVVESTKRGSGIGVRNVQERIQMQFGRKYGLFIESELDEGTTVTIKIPAIPYESWEGSLE